MTYAITDAFQNGMESGSLVGMIVAVALVAVGCIVYVFVLPNLPQISEKFGQKKPVPENVVCAPRLMKWISIGCLICVLILSILMSFTKPTQSNRIALAVFVALFVVPDFVLSAWSINFRLVYFKNMFTYRTIFRRTYRFSYAEITRLQEKKRYDHLYVGKHHFWIDKDCDNYICFEGMVIRQKRSAFIPLGGIRKVQNATKKKYRPKKKRK